MLFTMVTISSKVLTLDRSTGTGTMGVWWSAISRAAGRAILATCRVSSSGSASKCPLGLDTNQTTAPGGYSFRASSSTVSTVVGSANVAQALFPLTVDADMDLGIILRSGTFGGAFFVFRHPPAYPDWCFLDFALLRTEATYYPTIYGASQQGTQKLRDLRVTDLPAPWNSHYGPVVNTVYDTLADWPGYPTSLPFTHPASFLLSFATSGMVPKGYTIRFRKVDASNFYYLKVNADGSGAYGAVSAGVDQVIATIASPTFSGNSVMVRVMNGTFSAWANSVSTTVVSPRTMTAFASATDGEIVLNADPDPDELQQFCVYPFYLSGAAADALNACY